ncbi:hypothetical protein BX592_101348 [Paraburkholderia rhizosphaerae]|uniref:Uncharacterized protein n=1 Tax=Paraburkholderia rhizosphaerae TaxID=480658 RepID=A0A4R8M500_9BURK|nr:hypothetical protein BX592_101348 [Paraburkholderia rhizosphaerae]
MIVMRKLGAGSGEGVAVSVRAAYVRHTCGS